MAKDYTKKPKTVYHITKDGKRIECGSLECSGTVDPEPHDTFGPLDGRKVYCYLCGPEERAKVLQDKADKKV